MTLDGLHKSFEEERARFALWKRSQFVRREVAKPNPSPLEQIYQAADEEAARWMKRPYTSFLGMIVCPLPQLNVVKKACLLHKAETEGMDAALMYKLAN